MTVIVGVVDGVHVYLGADSRSSAGSLARELAEPKIWRQGSVVFGVAGRSREAQILEYATIIPDPPAGADLLRWICTDVVDVMRAARKAAGYDERCENQPQVEWGPFAVMGVCGRLFVVYGDYGVAEYPDGAAIGSGETAARGSLHTTMGMALAPRERIDYALTAACTHDVYCAPPFTYVDTREDGGSVVAATGWQSADAKRLLFALIPAQADVIRAAVDGQGMRINEFSDRFNVKAGGVGKRLKGIETIVALRHPGLPIPVWLDGPRGAKTIAVDPSFARALHALDTGETT